MTAADALKVKVGDLLTTKISGKWAVVEVTAVFRNGIWLAGALDTNNGSVYGFRVLRRGTPHKDHFGNLMTGITRHHEEVGFFDPAVECRKDTTAANVYADFLDDHGYHDAARLLRETFPMGVPE